MKKVLKWLFIIIVFIIGIVLYARFVGTMGLTTKEYVIMDKDVPDNFDGLKIVHFSDLHYNRAISLNKVKSIVNEINDINPDIVVFTGDLIDRDAIISDNDYDELANILGNIKSKYGNDSVALSISDRYTNEEAYAIKKLADLLEVKTLCFNHRESGLNKVLGVNASPNSMDELLATDVILAIGFKPENNPILGIKLKKAAKNGTKLLFVNPSEYKISNYGFDAKTVYTSNEVSKIKEIAKALIDMGKTSDVEGFGPFKASLENIEVSDEIREIAEIYANAKKAMIVFQQNMVTTDVASLIGEIAMLSGHIGSPRDGILQVKPKCNSQGLIDLGVTDGREALKGVKGLLCFGEDPDVDLSSLEFLMVSDTHMTKTAMGADVVLPATSFASTFGTFTNTERRLQRVNPAMKENVEVPNWKIPTILSKIYEKDFGFTCINDIRLELNDVNELYREGNVEQLLGGVLKPLQPKFVYIPDGLMVTPLKSTDNLMNKINEEIFKGLI